MTGGCSRLHGFSPSQFFIASGDCHGTYNHIGARLATPAPASQRLATIGVGIDTARYGHRVSFLRPDRQPAAKKLLVLENHDSYQALQERLEQLHQQHPQAHFHVRIDAAGQYATNLERFLRSLPLPMTLSIGEPKRNKDYQKAHFPKRQTDETESIAMARFAVVEEPAATAAVPEEMAVLAAVAGRLQAQSKQATQAVNRLHNLLARVFPELANLTNNFAAAWVLELLTKYPSAAKIGQARLTSLQKIPYLSKAKAQELHQAAKQSVGSLRGAVAETLVRELVAEVRHSQAAENKFRHLLTKTYAALPAGKHTHLTSIPGIGNQTAAIMVAKIIDIDRFATPEPSSATSAFFPRNTLPASISRGGPFLPARWSCRHAATTWSAAICGWRPFPAYAPTRRCAPCTAASKPRANAAMSPWATACASSCTWSTPSGKPASPLIPKLSLAPGCRCPGRRNYGPRDNNTSRQRAPRTTTPTTTTNDKAVGHKRDQVPEKKVVTTAPSNVKPGPTPVNPPSASPARP